ncbi:hypothetical protein C0995_011836 [Termitomyces sp. Mi166|nr:hypothetical protein C0995_011836 [Termitomyces sp. Mi166\
MTPKVVIEQGEWDRHLHEVQVTKSDLNRLIMDYLVIEGYKRAAEEFSQEADIAPPVDFESIESRMNIREALQRGDIDDAITRVNDLNPEILDTNPALYFHLQQQKLIEYIRSGRIAEALEFAQSELARRGEESPEYLSELERTMALLAFEGLEAAPASISELMSPGQRMKTAGEVNGAILESLSQGKEVKLAGLLKLLGWGEELLGEKREFPRSLSTLRGLPAVAASCELAAMSDDARASRRRRLIVTNPGSDNDSDDDKPFSTLYRSARPQPQPPPPAPTARPPHHSSSASSPSESTSSPAADDSAPPVLDYALEPLNPLHDAPPGPTSRTGRIIQTLRLPFHRSNNRPLVESPPRRPRTSPALPTAESLSGKTLIVVTADSDWYVTVDISGAANAAFIRERIFNKLNIRDDEQSRFAVYQTEMGAYALGEPLTDEKLFAYCRDKGDSKGSLKFFVTDSPTPVHDQSPQPQRSYSPTVPSLPPPVLPSFNSNSGPLRPKRRSRQESVSSANEQHILESAGGYEADLDNPDRDRDNYKPAPPPPPPPHPLPSPPQHHPSANALTSPRHARRLNGPLPRPGSPHLRPPPRLNSPPPAETSRPELGNTDLRQFTAIPSLSPNRSTFTTDEDVLLPSAHRLHGRTGSDAAIEHEQALRATEQHGDSGRQLRTRQLALGVRLRPQPSKESLSPSKDRRNRYALEEDPARSDSWVVVPPHSGRSDGQDLSLPTQDNAQSGARPSQPPSRPRVTSPYTGRPLAFPVPPRHPPPVPTPPREAREIRPPLPRPSAGVPLPHKLFAWRGEQRSLSSTNQWNRLPKGSKSVDNLRALNHPATLQPSTTPRRPPQLPMTRPTPQPPPIPSYSSYSPGLPRSYESRPAVRPLPVQGSLHSSTVDLGRDTYNSRGTSYNMVSSQDPYPRPQSASGDSMTSPTRRHRIQSPTYNGADSGDSFRSPRAISPGRYQSSASRLENSHSKRSDRSSDLQSGAETSYSTPPHTPISPRSPLNPNRDNTNSSRPSTSDSKVNGIHELHRGSESTLRPEDQQWFAATLNSSSEGTIIASRGQMNGRTVRPDMPAPSPVTSELSESTFFNRYESEVDLDEYGTSIWKKRPTTDSDTTPKLILRPPLKVQIETVSSSSSSSSSTLQNPQELLLPLPRRPVTPSQPDLHLLAQPQKRPPVSVSKGPRGSTFTDRQSSTWAPRPPPEDVYERLEEFFPEHDLDKPVIEASSGGTSPTAMEPAIPVPPTPPPPEREKARTRNKKSIRIVAEEHKRLIDRSSRGDAASYSNVFRKRSTKLWGSKLEEVTPAQGKMPLPMSHSAPDSPSNGTTFKWVRGELIGRGTYGRVYLALNATTGEMIAVKQVELPRTASDKSDSRQTNVVQALKMESETLKDLDHPNIVQYLGFEETPENLSIFLEYVPGGSIGSCLLKHGKFSEDVTKSFTGQILDGLAYLHSKGILHRDLKADNILVEMSGVCKISDFGISKRTDDASGGAYTAMQGTVFWMAPEVINTQKKGYNFKADIWSVGCVVLEMWAGSRPWTGDEVVAVMFKLYQSKQPPPVPPEVHLSELADDFRRKCFAINPDKRPSATELRKHPYLALPPDWVFTDF